MSIVSSYLSSRAPIFRINAQSTSIMDSIFAIVFGLGVRVVIDVVSHQDNRLTGTLVGLWEGIVMQHFLKKMPKSFDPYVAYGVRLFVDFLFTESLSRLVLTLVWTGMGIILADVAPAIWIDAGLRRFWRRFRRDLYIISQSLPTIPWFARPRTVRFSPSRAASVANSIPPSVITNTPQAPTESLAPTPRKRPLPGDFPGYASETETDLGSILGLRSPRSDASTSPGTTHHQYTALPRRRRTTVETESELSYDLDDGNISSSDTSYTRTPTFNEADMPVIEDEDAGTEREIALDKGKRREDETTPKQNPTHLPPTPSDSAVPLPRQPVNEPPEVQPPAAEVPNIPDDEDGWENITRNEAILNDASKKSPPTPPPKDEPTKTTASSELPQRQPAAKSKQSAPESKPEHQAPLTSKDSAAVKASTPKPSTPATTSKSLANPSSAKTTTKRVTTPPVPPSTTQTLAAELSTTKPVSATVGGTLVDLSSETTTPLPQPSEVNSDKKNDTSSTTNLLGNNNANANANKANAAWSTASNKKNDTSLKPAWSLKPQNNNNLNTNSNTQKISPFDTLGKASAYPWSLAATNDIPMISPFGDLGQSVTAAGGGIQQDTNKDTLEYSFLGRPPSYSSRTFNPDDGGFMGQDTTASVFGENQDQKTTDTTTAEPDLNLDTLQGGGAGTGGGTSQTEPSQAEETAAAAGETEEREQPSGELDKGAKSPTSEFDEDEPLPEESNVRFVKALGLRHKIIKMERNVTEAQRQLDAAWDDNDYGLGAEKQLALDRTLASQEMLNRKAERWYVEASNGETSKPPIEITLSESSGDGATEVERALTRLLLKGQPSLAVIPAGAKKGRRTQKLALISLCEANGIQWTEKSNTAGPKALIFTLPTSQQVEF